MSTQIQKLPKSRIKLTIEVPAERMGQFFDEAYKKLASTVEIKGFRPGTAPKQMTIEAIGQNRYLQQVLDLALPATYGEVLRENKILPVSSPVINLENLAQAQTGLGTLKYIAEVDILPEIKLGDYRKIRIKKVEVQKPAEKDIEGVLVKIRQQNAKFHDVSRPAKKNDRVEIDFEGEEGGIKREYLSSQNYPLILGSNVLIPGFEDKLIGVKKGDQKNFSLKMPIKEPHFAEASQGRPDKPENKTVNFTVKIHDVKEMELPPLDDVLATKFGKKSLVELKKAVKEDLEKVKIDQARASQEKELVDKLLKITEIDIPQSLIDQEIDRMINVLAQQAQGMGMKFEQYLEKIKKTVDQLRQDLKPQAERTVSVGLLLGEVIKREGLDVKDKEAGKKAFEKLLDYATK